MKTSHFNLLHFFNANVRFFLAFVLVVFGSSAAWSNAPASEPYEAISGHVPVQHIKNSALLGQKSSSDSVSMTVVLRYPNEAQLNSLLSKLYDPLDPSYGHFLTTQQFTDQFSPSQSDYQAIQSYFKSQGFTVAGIHSNRLVLNVSAPVVTAGQAFNVQFNEYAQGSRHYYSVDREPALPHSVADKILHIAGLQNANVWHKHAVPLSPYQSMGVTPNQVGTGPNGGLQPSDIASIYELNSAALPASKGLGQTIGLFELDGFAGSDITAYETKFGLPKVQPTTVLIDGFNGKPGSGADEVTLDIELQMAVAPSAKIIVYEGPNSGAGVIDTYQKIATDNLAKQISTSWGLCEQYTSSGSLTAENAIFKQMAAQGQTIFAASGDSGAYDCGGTSLLNVDDPASQPYVVGVGGTSLKPGSGEAYSSETVWNTSSTEGGGGGVSTFWALPSYQANIPGLASIKYRNVPDVSLDADPYTGYAIYSGGAWQIYGGTSCAAPIWAAYTAIVNQQRQANGSSTLGFLNPTLYALAQTSSYSADFHDITTGNNNHYYAAIGYDNATGWGSFNGLSLFYDLVAGPSRSATSTTLASSANPSGYGSAVTFTATVTGSSPTGTVTFIDGTTTLGTGAVSSGKATFATSSLTVGTHGITAAYSGDTKNNASTSTALTQTVNKAATSAALASSLNPSGYGSAVTFTATVTGSSPTGTVTFKDGTTTLGTGAVSSGKATLATSSLSAGTHSITAAYSGDTKNNASTSTALTQTVNKKATTATVVSSKNPSVRGTSVTFTATVTGSSPTGTVTFNDGTAKLGTGVLSTSGKATYATATLAIGTHKITASYGGDTNNTTSVSAALSQAVK